MADQSLSSRAKQVTQKAAEVTGKTAAKAAEVTGKTAAKAAEVTGKTAAKHVAVKTVPVKVGQPGKRGKKAISTPTKDDVTLSDLTLDASCISARSSLDVTMQAPTKLRLGGGGTRASKSGGTLPKNDCKLKQPLLPPRMPQTVTKIQSRTKDMEEEDEITDEMLDMAYTKYLQAHYIAMKTKENLEMTRKKCDQQLFEAFSATEAKRQQVMQKQRENIVWDALVKLDRSLSVVHSLLAPALEVLGGVEQQLGLLAEGLNRVQHNLVVQGVTIADQEKAQAELESVCSQLKDFLSSASHYDTVALARGEEAQRLAAELSNLAEHYGRSIQLMKDCRKLVVKADSLATQEASLALSLDQLCKEKEKI